jgi:cation diffusion facilitator CzcD-associated flavoprotein CzcO
MSRESLHTLIVGAGAAGLAVGACLRRVGVPFEMLEQADRVGSMWHGLYESFRLDTDRGTSALPYMPFPAGTPRYPSRQQVVDYLAAYARRFALEPRFGERVRAAYGDGGRWVVETDGARCDAANLVVATGHNRLPRRERWPGQEAFEGPILHSSEFRRGASYRGRRVLVVGFRSSAGDIAIDLHRAGARTAMAVRGGVNVVPRDLLGIPIVRIARLLALLPSRLSDALNAPVLWWAFGSLRRYGLTPRDCGPITEIWRDGRIPHIDVGTMKLVRDGHVLIYPGIRRFTPRGVVFDDGRAADFDAVILATGYRAAVDEFLREPDLLRDGDPVASGAVSPRPGLYFCGFRITPAGLLHDVGVEARQIGAAIARRPVAPPAAAESTAGRAP